MKEIFNRYYKKYISNSEVIVLLSSIILCCVIIFWFGSILAPVLISIVVAYLLERLVKILENLRMPRILAVNIVFWFCVNLFIFLILLIIPLVIEQLNNLLQSMPEMFAKGQKWVIDFANQYADYISISQLQDMFGNIRSHFVQFGRLFLSFSLSSLSGILQIIIYFILVPILVFFMLKDKHKILQYFTAGLPKESNLLTTVLVEVHHGLGNYIRGKCLELILITVVSLTVFLCFHLEYSLLLAIGVGISVFIPYVGAAVITVPVALVGFFQFGMQPIFAYLMIVYFIIQFIDGNILVPIIFSEVIKIHPLAILVALILFGGLWGFWGVFFAVPLALLIRVLINNLANIS